MRKFFVILAIAASVGAASASSQLVAHPKCDTMLCREASQQQNLKHARYLCNRGANEPKRWGCQAVQWLTRELSETQAVLHPVVASDLNAWTCIHNHEGSWSSNTGNGYYGGLQMDVGFQSKYGSDFVRRWGTADHWPPWAQIEAARRARDSGRGYGPWPNTAAMCGLT